MSQLTPAELLRFLYPNPREEDPIDEYDEAVERELEDD